LQKNIVMLSSTEENYLKSIYKCIEITQKAVNTNTIAAKMGTTAASVTDMIKRLAEKEYVLHQKYYGVLLTEKGTEAAKILIRKQRLWKVFLVEWLHFSWDEVNELAEQLEHIHSEELINRLDVFLNLPKFDPLGEAIPNAEGVFAERKQLLISDLSVDSGGVMVAVKDDTSVFLQELDALDLAIGTRIDVLEISPADNSLKVILNNEKEVSISQKISENIFVKPFHVRNRG
jgi:DtxR family transcriptional regulator, Mn-dependent transcriptional regulator